MGLQARVPSWRPFRDGTGSSAGSWREEPLCPRGLFSVGMANNYGWGVKQTRTGISAASNYCLTSEIIFNPLSHSCASARMWIKIIICFIELELNEIMFSQRASTQEEFNLVNICYCPSALLFLTEIKGIRCMRPNVVMMLENKTAALSHRIFPWFWW